MSTRSNNLVNPNAREADVYKRQVYHLHFAMRADGQSVDPGEYLPQF